MEYRKITAIINVEKLSAVEQELLRKKVPGISLTQVLGYGEYQNFYKSDMMCRHARIEIFCRAEEADGIARCIMNAAHTGISGDGIVAILPAEHLYCIRTKTELAESDCC